MTKCAHCGSVILFGASTFEGRLYCATCKTTVEGKKHFATSGAKYHNALERLKADPRNPSLREKALEFGRLHASWGRHLQGAPGVTTFDEVALANDIQAACAAAIASAPEAATVESRLEKLASLFERGLITEIEHRERRQCQLYA